MFSYSLLLLRSFFSFSFRSLEVIRLINSSHLFLCLVIWLLPCSIFSSCDIDSAISVSMSCNSSVAILTLLEAVLQQLCSSTLCLLQTRGSTLVSLILQKLLWRHNVIFLSRSYFNFSYLSLPPQSTVFNFIFSAVVTAFRCAAKARLKAADPMLIRYELYTLLGCDICILAYSNNHAVKLALNHGIIRLLANFCLTFIGWFKILHIVSKRSNSFTQASSSISSLVGASCRLFSLT